LARVDFLKKRMIVWWPLGTNFSFFQVSREEPYDLLFTKLPYILFLVFNDFLRKEKTKIHPGILIISLQLVFKLFYRFAASFN
jgi:hypothetical protein